MILARAGELLLIGLTKENVRRLEVGNPISISPQTHVGVFGEDHGPVERIGIFVGDDERHVVELLRSTGAFDEEHTKVVALPKGRHHGSDPS